jgi:hypothetical protein
MNTMNIKMRHFGLRRVDVVSVETGTGGTILRG